MKLPKWLYVAPQPGVVCLSRRRSKDWKLMKPRIKRLGLSSWVSFSHWVEIQRSRTPQ